MAPVRVRVPVPVLVSPTIPDPAPELSRRVPLKVALVEEHAEALTQLEADRLPEALGSREGVAARGGEAVAAAEALLEALCSAVAVAVPLPPAALGEAEGEALAVRAVALAATGQSQWHQIRSHGSACQKHQGWTRLHL